MFVPGGGSEISATSARQRAPFGKRPPPPFCAPGPPCTAAPARANCRKASRPAGADSPIAARPWTSAMLRTTSRCASPAHCQVLPEPSGGQARSPSWNLPSQACRTAMTVRLAHRRAAPLRASGAGAADCPPAHRGRRGSSTRSARGSRSRAPRAAAAAGLQLHSIPAAEGRLGCGHVGRELEELAKLASLRNHRLRSLQGGVPEGPPEAVGGPRAPSS